jgi:hypothetical protein
MPRASAARRGRCGKHPRRAFGALLVPPTKVVEKLPGSKADRDD